MNISSLKKEELENLNDSINSKIKDSSYAPYAPIDLTTVDNSKHPITIEPPILIKDLSKITDNIQKFRLAKEKEREEKEIDDFINKPKKPKI